MVDIPKLSTFLFEKSMIFEIPGPSRPPPPKSGEGSPDGDEPFGSAANKGKE